MSTQNFHQRLKEAMQNKNVKQIDVLRAAEVQNIKLGKSHMSQYVSGKSVPRENILNFLANYLEVSPQWLKGETLPSENHSNITGEIPMRKFNKSSKLDNVLYDVRGPVVDEATRMEEAGTHILKLNIGNPAPFGFRAPDEVIYDMARQLTECEGYSHSKGQFSARKAIMQYMQEKNVPNVQMDNIFTGNGVSELINLSLQA